MAIEVDFSALFAAARKMGGEPVVFAPRLSQDDIPDIEIQLSGSGIEITPDGLEVVGGLLAYQGYQVLLYIRDHGSDVQAALENPRARGRKFHVADCRTLREMQEKGKFERYVVTRDLSGSFEIEGTELHGRAPVVGRAALWVCQNCLTYLNYEASALSPRARQRATRDFKIDRFFETFSSRFRRLPKRSTEQILSEGYTADWPEISMRMRREAGFQCAKCSIDLTERKDLLHVHHINGVKSDNSRSNLKVLCVACHRDEPDHHHMHVPHEAMQYITAARKALDLISGGSWVEVRKYVDPALMGFVTMCESKDVPVPEVGHEPLAVGGAGRVLCQIELAWVSKKVGVCISDADKEAAQGAGWRIWDGQDALDKIGVFVRGVR